MSDRTWRSHSLVQLTLLRYASSSASPRRCFGRWPSRIIATRPRRRVPESAGGGRAHRRDVTPSSRRRSARTSRWTPSCSPRSRRRTRCGPARCCSWSSRAPDGAVSYRYDDTNPEARTARAVVDRAVQVAGGRVDPVPVEDDLVREAGLAVHRLRHARACRHGHHGQRVCGTSGFRSSTHGAAS